MWLSERTARTAADGGGARVGEITIGGREAAVLAEGERRGAAFFSPGGYRWLPRAGERVLLVPCEGGGLAVAGAALGELPEPMQAGEICIGSVGGAELRLKNSGGLEISGDLAISGNVSITGSLTVNGVVWAPPAVV